jgi:RNA polymerase sigma-70 factor (ECF subfamily)
LFHDVAAGFSSAAAKAGETSVTPAGFTDAHFDELFLAHYAQITAILFRVVGDWGQAEELASEAFLKLYRQPLPQVANSNVGGWLYRTAMNLGIDALRSSARRKRYEQAAVHAEAHPAAEDAFDQLLRAENQQRVRAVLAELKPEQAQLLVLRASGHSYKELAQILDVQPGAIGTRLIRAEAAFEKRYREMYGSQEGV